MCNMKQALNSVIWIALVRLNRQNLKLILYLHLEYTFFPSHYLLSFQPSTILLLEEQVLCHL